MLHATTNSTNNSFIRGLVDIAVERYLGWMLKWSSTLIDWEFARRATRMPVSSTLRRLAVMPAGPPTAWQAMRSF
jgi:hypothetical protein